MKYQIPLFLPISNKKDAASLGRRYKVDQPQGVALERTRSYLLFKERCYDGRTNASVRGLAPATEATFDCVHTMFYAEDDATVTVVALNGIEAS